MEIKQLHTSMKWNNLLHLNVLNNIQNSNQLKPGQIEPCKGILRLNAQSVRIHIKPPIHVTTKMKKRVKEECDIKTGN